MAAAQIILASRSPRRAELLRQIGVDFEQIDVEVDETPLAGEAPQAYVLRLARQKAAAARRAQGQQLELPVLAADTAVIVDGQILGKPTDRADGIAMLQQLSARSHLVLSGVALADARGEQAMLSQSRVTFRALALSEIEAYWETGEPLDKAGAYGIQGLAALFITELQGSYSGVMGLPLHETGELLRQTALPLLGNNNSNG